jgi:hypothetical protein
VSDDGPRRTNTTQFLIDLGIDEILEEHRETVVIKLESRMIACRGESGIWRFDIPDPIVHTIATNAGSIAKIAAGTTIAASLERLAARMPSVAPSEIRAIPVHTPGAKFCVLCGHSLTP